MMMMMMMVIIIIIITRNRKHHLEGNVIPAEYSHTNAHYVDGVNNYLNSNHMKYLAQLCGRFFLRFGKFPTQICDSCGATYQSNYETFSAL